MVEVFKTNVITTEHADWLIYQIHHHFPDYKANFDLTDCDRILRIKNVSGPIESDFLISFLKQFRCRAEILSDESESVLSGINLLFNQIS